MPVLVGIRAEEEAGHSSGGVSLTWLLPLAIGGGVLLFIAVGLLLAWKIKDRHRPCAPLVYSMQGAETQQSPSRRSTARLTKRQRFMSSASSSKFSSRLSLSLPPVLPPLPGYDEFLGQARGRTRERSWVDEDAFHGPRVNRRSARDSWLFSRDSWFGRLPTLPAVEAQAQAQAQTQEQTKPTSHVRTESNGSWVVAQQAIQLPKRNSQSPVKQVQTTPQAVTAASTVPATLTIPAPIMAMQHGALRNWSRPTNNFTRPIQTENSLQDILRSTEERLRTGGSQVYERSIPPSSSTDTALSQPSDSAYSLDLMASTSNKNLGVAPRRTGDQRLSPLHRRNSSVFSMVATASSAVETKQEFEVQAFAGRQTFGQLNSHESEQQIDLDLESPVQRPASAETHASSALSTVYSVGEPEDDKARGLRAPTHAHDATVLMGETRAQVITASPQRQQDVAVMSVGSPAEEIAMPTPLRPMSHNSKQRVLNDGGIIGEPEPLSIRGVSPSPPLEKARPIARGGQADQGCKTPTRSTGASGPSGEQRNARTEPRQQGTPCSVWCVESEPSRSPPRTPPTGEAINRAAEELSPAINEDELMSMLMSATTTAQDLHALSTNNRAVANASPATQLAPRPRLRLASGVRRASRCSSVASDYDNDWWTTSELDVGTPSRRRSNRNSQAIGSTIAQLRRMNSTLSTYSIASTLYNEGEASHLGAYPPSPTKPISSRHYFNLGSGPGSVRSMAKQQQHAQRRRSSRRISLAMQPAPLMQHRQQQEQQYHSHNFSEDHGKENQAPNGMVSQDDDNEKGARGHSRLGKSGTFSRDPTLVGRAALVPVDEVKVEEDWQRSIRRDIAVACDDDLSMYDNGDGFLQDDTEKDAKKRCLRM